MGDELKIVDPTKRLEASARSAHRATLENLSGPEQAAFIDMMQRIVTAHSSHDSASVIFD